MNDNDEINGNHANQICPINGLFFGSLVIHSPIFTLENRNRVGLRVIIAALFRRKNMSIYPSTYTEKISQEIEKTPDEYLPALLEMVRLFRETVTLKPAELSFRQGWQEAMNGEVLSADQLWNDVDAA